MKRDDTIALIRLVLDTLPAAISTGAEIVALIAETYNELSRDWESDAVTREEITEAVNNIAHRSRLIQAAN